MSRREMEFDQPPVTRVEVSTTSSAVTPGEWPMTIPAVAQLAHEGLDLARGVTFLVGENGSGKSTLVEAVAMAFGLSPEGGSSHSRHRTRPSESPLGAALRLHRGLGASRWGFFLRAETMHGWYTYVDALNEPDVDGPGWDRGRTDPDFHAMSHGESFLEVLRSRFDSPAFYCLDEPEAALSFSATLALMSTLHDVSAAGGQVLCATHSPVLASLPGATILEVGEWGYRPARWEDLDLVVHWKAFLDAPGRYLRHVLD